MPNDAAMVYSVEALRAGLDARQGVPLQFRVPGDPPRETRAPDVPWARLSADSSAAQRLQPVHFGRVANADVDVAMTWPGHPNPRSVSSTAGAVYLHGGSVIVVNLSTHHTLYIRRWPHAARDALERAPKDSTQLLHGGSRKLGQGLWWVYTSEVPEFTPGWILIQVLGRSRARVAESTTHRDNTVDTLDERLHQRRRRPLGPEHLDFLVASFQEYLTVPPKAVPHVRKGIDVDAKRSNSYREKIAEVAYPGGKPAGGAYGIFNSDLFPHLFEGDGAITFQQVEKVLDRLGLDFSR